MYVHTLLGILTPKMLCTLTIEQLATRSEQEEQRALLQKKFDAGVCIVYIT